ncbi:Glycerol-3-phosphate responsive antiterminator (mRNA-binding) [Rubrobacter radiotolerans]|uniref:Glycerol-3-phosphate responsive antiterminator n=1 Tax=Rubrobacter radiotolerans TaxID=42256 RepID=A0A023X2S1_RUBRA|nr:glycerol-3-phosphate responsive antiterminator [Rubrobacter radiotolerans]AHY46305.1 Glycerol-3-phosphate responsive antiterminator (mRNA-binding) [Rubrobacter radiotolerans]MDX5893712.1 glycerol-3-phosphate responsive antiterminator [Rubrobacter radiotolerans]SMC04335.1 glycerol uptake operon antiterminator [Rubrobacter radiotolerans DSM 5868]
MGKETRGSERKLKKFVGLLKANPVIPAVREPGVDLERALSGDHAAIFVLGGDVFEVLRTVKRKYRRPSIFINVDTVGGIAADASGIKYLSGEVDGIITTHRNVVESARGTGLVTVQRLFAIDSSAVSRGVRLIRAADPDCVEILPAVAYPEFAALYEREVARPVLAGGLVRDFKTASRLVEAGAAGISTSERLLWKLA